MSLLAERRKKQRISVDPRNVAWKTDNEKVGQKLLEKMGWSEGKGLGRQEQGVTENIRLKANHTARGLGSEVINHDAVWMGHHDDFESILANLNRSKNQSKGAASTDENEKTLKSTGESRIQKRYKKFTKGKDFSSYSDKDKSAILGISKNKSNNPIHVEEVPDVVKNTNISLTSNTTVSQMSMNDYFANKMAALRAKSNQDVGKEINKSEESAIGKKKRKRQQSGDSL